MSLTGKSALVTGAAKRVGRAIALELASRGCDIVAHYCRSETDALTLRDEVISRGRGCMLVQGDLRDADCWPRLINEAFQANGRLDILINNASQFIESPLAEFDVSHWEEVFRINVIAAVALSQSAAAHLAASGNGKIVNLADISAETPWKRHAAYCSSKAALVNATRALAKAFAPNVQINAVSPGIAVFPEDYDASMRERLIAEVPLRRAGTPEDIARTVRFLCEDGHYITGQVIAVDGGRSIR